MNTYNDLTQHELHALEMDNNVADAHTHQSQSSSQQHIVARLPELWYEAENSKQTEVEERFLKALWKFRKQPYAAKTPSMPIYASSIALVLAANYFAKRKLSVALMTPCFDNLYDIMNNMQVPLEPLKEEWLHNPDTIYKNLSEHVTADVLFIITPNNPTGWALTQFEQLIHYAKDHNKILSFDVCFASMQLFADEPVVDMYKLLEESGVSYIVYEDTGKTWPLQDTKVAVIKCSKDIYPELYNMYTAYILNVSPFILNVVTQYIEDSIADNGQSIISLIERNREIVRETLEGKLLKMHTPQVPMSVAWFEILDSEVRATDLQKHIFDEAGVYVLPGNFFYWEDQERGQKYIRIALARDTKDIERAANNIRNSIETYEK